MKRKKRAPNSVKGSPWKLSKRVFQVEDEFLKQAQNAARAKTLCAKFEHWEETDGKTTTSNQHIAEMEIAQNSSGEQLSIESASSLRARFESLGSQTNESPRTPKVKVNRFVVSTLSSEEPTSFTSIHSFHQRLIDPTLCNNFFFLSCNSLFWVCRKYYDFIDHSRTAYYFFYLFIYLFISSLRNLVVIYLYIFFFLGVKHGVS